MNTNAHGIWLSNSEGKPTPPSTTTSATSSTVASTPRSDLHNNITTPGGTASSLTFYKASLASRLKQLNDGHHAALMYSALQDLTPLIHHGPPLISETQTFEQTHADFHLTFQARDPSPYVFCAVCGARLRHQQGPKEAVVEQLGTDEIMKRLVGTKLEDDDNVSVNSESEVFRGKESER